MYDYDDLMEKGLKKIYFVEVEIIRRMPQYENKLAYVDPVEYSEVFPTLEEAEEAYDKMYYGFDNFKELLVYDTDTGIYQTQKSNYDTQIQAYIKENNIPEDQLYQFYVPMM